MAAKKGGELAKFFGAITAALRSEYTMNQPPLGEPGKQPLPVPATVEENAPDHKK